MNKAAQQLGRMAKGKKKQLSQKEIERRTKQLADARKKRWPKKESIFPANVKDHSPIGAVSASNPESNSAAPIG